ncbi:MAG: hypothetical protein R3E18_10845 [Sphingomonadaceae bacterium]|nr:hypothetical protein [Sphingomonadaceae bacterium]
MTKAIFRTTILAAASLATVMAAPAMAGTVTASGTQTRGVAGRNAELKGQAVSLPATCTISSVSGQNAGFWLQGSRTITFNDMASAKGRSVPAGTYNVYPNLKSGSGTASVQVTFSCP